MVDYMIYKACINSMLLNNNINHRYCSSIESDIYSGIVPEGDKKVLIIVVLLDEISLCYEIFAINKYYLICFITFVLISNIVLNELCTVLR